MKYGRWTQYFWKWHTTSIFDQWKITSTFYQWTSLVSWFLVCNIVSIHLDEIWKTTSIFFENQRRPHFFTLEDYFNFLKMEDHLFFWKCKTTSKCCIKKCNFNQRPTAQLKKINLNWLRHNSKLSYFDLFFPITPIIGMETKLATSINCHSQTHHQLKLGVTK